MAILNESGLNESVFGPALSPWTSPFNLRLGDGDFVRQPVATGVTYYGNNAVAQVDFVFGDVELMPLADHNTGIFGTITGDLISDDSWFSHMRASQIYGDIRVEEGNHSSYTIFGSVGGYVEIEDTRNTTFSAGKADDLYAEESSNLRLNVMDGRDGDFAIYDSRDVRLGIVNAEDAYVDIMDSTMTEVHVGFGDVTVFDGGSDSKIRLGSGDDYVTLAGKTGQTLLNAGAGDDTVYKTGSADAIIKFGDGDDKFVFSLRGDVTAFDVPESGRVDLGNSDADLYDLLRVFGENDDGDAVLKYNDPDAFDGISELTFLGAAEQLIPPVVDDFDLGKG